MDMNTRLHLIVNNTRFGACDETSTLLDHGMHDRGEFEYCFIWKRILALVIEIDEKPENVCFLLHYI
jgi:hypothetical protein